MGLTHLFWGLVVIPVAVLFVAGGIVIYLAIQKIDYGVYSTHLEIGRRAQFAISESLSAVVKEMHQIAREIAKKEDAHQTYSVLLKDNFSFESVSYIGVDGREIVRVERSLLITTKDLRDFSDTAGFVNALEGKDFFTDMFYSAQGEPTISIFVPVRSVQAEIIGVEKVDLNLKFLWRLMDEIVVGKSGKVYVVDARGFPIADPDSSLVLRRENLLTRKIIERTFAKGEADSLLSADRYINNEGIEVFSVGLLEKSVGWAVMTEEPVEEAFSASRGVFLSGIAFLFIAGILLVLLMLGLRRILLLTNFTDKLRIEVEKRTKELNEKIKVLNETNSELDETALLLHHRDAALTDANDRLRELDKVKSEFISVAAHQLRTPLSAIKWILSILVDDNAGNLSDEQRGLILKGIESNERIIKLVNDMLVVTRIESGKIQFNIVPVHIEDIIESVILDFASEARVRKMQLSFTTPSAKLPYIQADPEKIRSVIQNLIENSMRYTKDGGEILITASLELDKLKVSIKDNGVGIPTRQQSSIFSKFFRADNAIKIRTDGSGLGLFIAKNIVEKHDGQIWFESKESSGTIFQFTIPVHMS